MAFKPMSQAEIDRVFEEERVSSQLAGRRSEPA
jgi:hypothetical protein